VRNGGHLAVTKMIGKEAFSALALVGRHVRVASGVDVQALHARADRREQCQGVAAGDQLVVPLHDQLHRHGDAGRVVDQALLAHQAQHGGGDPRLARDQGHADGRAQGEPDEADRPWGAAVGLQGAEHRAPLQDRLSGDLDVQPGDRGRRCAPGHVGGQCGENGGELR